MLLKLRYDEPLSNFGFNSNLRRYDPDHRVADWVDIGEMVTAACFTSDGDCAVAGSYKVRRCRLTLTNPR